MEKKLFNNKEIKKDKIILNKWFHASDVNGIDILEAKEDYIKIFISAAVITKDNFKDSDKYNKDKKYRIIGRLQLLEMNKDNKKETKRAVPKLPGWEY